MSYLSVSPPFPPVPFSPVVNYFVLPMVLRSPLSVNPCPKDFLSYLNLKKDRLKQYAFI